MAASFGQFSGDIALGTEVVEGNFVVTLTDMVGFKAAALFNDPLDLEGLDLVNYFADFVILSSDHPVHAAFFAQDPGDGPGVDALDAGDVVFNHVVVQTHVHAEIGPQPGKLAYYKGFDKGVSSFLVIQGNAVVADQGIVMTTL